MKNSITATQVINPTPDPETFTQKQTVALASQSDLASDTELFAVKSAVTRSKITVTDLDPEVFSAKENIVKTTTKLIGRFGYTKFGHCKFA